MKDKKVESGIKLTHKDVAYIKKGFRCLKLAIRFFGKIACLRD